jgi:dienelactone hydrolase
MVVVRRPPTEVPRIAPEDAGQTKTGDTVSVNYIRDGDTRTAKKIVLPAAPVSLTDEPVGRLAPDSSFTVSFPDVPPTFHALFTQQDVKAKMTIYLPRNYDPAREHPLLVYLNGWDGGDGNTLGVARGITGQQDFVCVSMPLFRAPGFRVEKANAPGKDFILTEPDGRAMWPLFKMMLDKVETLVPNIDKSHRVVGGFSNGAHAIAALVDGSDGEICKLLSAFLIVEGGGKLKHFEYLKGKRYMMVSSQSGSKPRALQIVKEAEAAGARTTFLFEDVGMHAFPVSAYPAVEAWLHGPALE